MRSGNKYPVYPTQISRDAPADLSIVAVVPWYAEDDPEAFFKKLEKLADNAPVTEVIVVVHSFEEDDDLLIKKNLDFYWLLEESKRTPLANGLHLEAILINGIGKRWKGSDIASYMGLAEASQRLIDAGKANGGIALIDVNYHYPDGYLSTLAHHYDQNANCGITNAYWEGMRASSSAESLHDGTVHQYELALKLHEIQLSRAQYPFPGHNLLFTLSMRAWVFDKIRDQIIPFTPLAPQLYHLGMLEGVDSKKLTGIAVGPTPDRIKALSRELPVRTPGAEAYRALYLLLLRADNFYRAQGPADFQEVIAGLPPLARAFLKEEGFYTHWYETLIHSYNTDNFKRQFLYWLNPQRVKNFFVLAAEYSPVHNMQTEAARFLRIEFGIRAQNLNPEALLHYLRGIEKGSFLSLAKKSA